jgi:RNA polymerase sigma factor (TIGR02999 family)
METSPKTPEEDFERLLDAVAEGGGTERLLELCYGELRRLADAQMSREPVGHTLQATALVHEAWLRLLGGRSARFESRLHFFRAAAMTMRRILVDRARRVQAEKRGGGAERVSLCLASDDHALTDGGAGHRLDLLALDEALDELAAFDPRLHELVQLRWFSGLDVPDTARLLGVSERTIKREWSVARAWLALRLADETDAA